MDIEYSLEVDKVFRCGSNEYEFLGGKGVWREYTLGLNEGDA